jgi:predicted RNA-binding protein with PUA-like domain
MGWRAQLSGTEFHASNGVGRSGIFLPRWECVDIKSLSAVDPPVTLAMIKKDPRLATMMLVNNPRLSVQPVSAEHWQIICDMHRGD